MVPDDTRKTPCSCALCRMEQAFVHKPEFRAVTQKLSQCLLAAVHDMKSKYDPDYPDSSDDRDLSQIVDDAALYMLIGKSLYEHTLEVLSFAQSTKLQAELESDDDEYDTATI